VITLAPRGGQERRSCRPRRGGEGAGRPAVAGARLGQPFRQGARAARTRRRQLPDPGAADRRALLEVGSEDRRKCFGRVSRSRSGSRQTVTPRPSTTGASTPSRSSGASPRRSERAAAGPAVEHRGGGGHRGPGRGRSPRVLADPGSDGGYDRPHPQPEAGAAQDARRSPEDAPAPDFGARGGEGEAHHADPDVDILDPEAYIATLGAGSTLARRDPGEAGPRLRSPPTRTSTRTSRSGGSLSTPCTLRSRR